MKILTKTLMLFAFLCIAFQADLSAQKAPRSADPYAAYVWPPPPDKPRIKLTAILSGRADVEGSSRFSKALIGASPQSRFDNLKKPFGVTFDSKGRLLVTDTELRAVIRFDQQGRRMDVFGTTGSTPLKTPMGVDVDRSGRIYVADGGLQKVLVYNDAGKMQTAYGQPGELANPTGVAVSPDQKRIYVSDAKQHRIAVFDIASGALVKTFGRRGIGDGELNFPTAVTFSKEGELGVVDQINCRVVIFSQDGDFVDSFGKQGVSFGSFARPKGIALDDAGLIYVTDAAFGNLQIFSNDLTLLTFIGTNGAAPGQFQLTGGVAVRGDDIAVADQLNHRIQLFRFIAPKTQR